MLGGLQAFEQVLDSNAPWWKMQHRATKYKTANVYVVVCMYVFRLWYVVVLNVVPVVTRRHLEIVLGAELLILK